MQERGSGRLCDTCRSAAATVHCRADSAYLCAPCDGRVHAANRVASRHERVRVCDACERAPAAFLCRADAASLCPACDADIHSANPLASRHHRVPVMPIQATDTDQVDGDTAFLLDDYLLDLVVDYNSRPDHITNQHYSVPQNNYARGDSVVPVQPKHQFYTYNGSFNGNVSVSSINAAPKPEMSDISISHPRQLKGGIDLFCGPPVQMLAQLAPMDREARVLRYREKKKIRKFQKTIRYASRKAYAEARPRIKGRFAKRSESEIDVDQMFSTAMMGESGYGIVPSF